MDDDDWVTPGYLEGLLAHAADGIVPVALVSTVAEGETTTPGPLSPDLDNYASRSLLPRAGQTVTCDLLTTALSYNAGKLIRTSLARQVRYDESLRSGEDFVYWLTLLTRAPFRLRIAEPGDDAIYCRSIRRTSLGRQGVSYDFMVSQRLDCLGALESVGTTAPVPAKVLRIMVRGQARWINEYLRDRPSDHARVVEDVRERGLRLMPWKQVNRGLARDLAVLYCFPPYLDTSGLVAARRLRERGLVTDVVSNDISRFRRLDQSSTKVASEVLGRTKVLGAAPSFGHWDSVTEFAALTEATVSEWEESAGPYRSVYSRSMAVASHFAAALVSLRRPDLEWVAEFSDPLRFHPDGSERESPLTPNWLLSEITGALDARGLMLHDERLFAYAELMTFALADRMIFTNARQRDLMLQHCPHPELRARVLARSEVRHHPTLPAEFYTLEEPGYRLDDTLVNIAYFGVFYVTRGLEEVTAAIESLAWAQRSRVRLHVFTSRPEKLRIEVAVAGLSDVVVVRPFLPFLQFLAMTRCFDALLVKDAEATKYFGLNPYLPSKLSDYRGSGTPVWSIVEPGSVMAGTPTEHHSHVGDSAGARDVLVRLLEQGLRTRTVPQAEIRDPAARS